MRDAEGQLLRDLAPGVDLPASRRLLVARRARHGRRRVFLAAVAGALCLTAGLTFAVVSRGPGNERISTADPSMTSSSLGGSSVPLPSSTSTSSSGSPVVCALGAELPVSPAGWTMTVRPGPGPSGDGPPTWWHILGPEEGRVIQILRGSSPLPPVELPPPTQVDGLLVFVYEVHEGYGATIIAAAADRADPCSELHLLGFGVSEADLRAVAEGVTLVDDR